MILSLLKQAWSSKSSTKWTKENPAKGQCGVTSLVVHDYLGGDILKTPVKDGWHYYNKTKDGEIIDLTQSQFDVEPEYQHLLSSREEAYSDTNEEQYVYLKSTMEGLLKT
ncbi:YunG family protein [Caldalkalibacillus mannanilyticus]|uniref:YunG family protein n=1 Tax=Caldalkalibacillus mannanilyticus TaxID=1418 RepID=UPI00055676C0|nr:hypothetical protein [Caldalkalibacillus mannanilyticus]